MYLLRTSTTMRVRKTMAIPLTNTKRVPGLGQVLVSVRGTQPPPSGVFCRVGADSLSSSRQAVV